MKSGLKIFLFSILVAVPSLLRAQGSISFDVSFRSIAEYDRLKENPGQRSWSAHRGFVIINLEDSEIWIEGVKFVIVDKIKLTTGYSFKCYDSANFGDCKISYTHQGNLKMVSLLKDGIIKSFINQLKE